MHVISPADISLLVAAYDVEPYIARCLESLTRQTLASIEIVVVDDGSTDGTPAIIDDFARRDPRIVVVRHTENRGIVAARKSGVDRATGRFIMFVDGDDTMPPEGCAVALDAIVRAGTEIVAFPPNVVAEPPATDEEVVKARRWLRHGSGKLTGSDILEACFVQKTYRPSVWGKIYLKHVVNKSFNGVSSEIIKTADDYYIYFRVSSECKSLFFVESAVVYNYHFGAGMTGFSAGAKSRFIAMSQRYAALAAIKDYVAGRPRHEQYLPAVRAIEDEFLQSTVNMWQSSIKDADAPAMFDLMVEAWGARQILPYLCDLYADDPVALARRVLGARSLEAPARAPKAVAFHYHRLANGGVERVLATLAPMLADKGLAVSVVTDEQPSKGDYPLASTVARVALGYPKHAYGEDLRDRTLALFDAIAKHQFGAVVFNAALSPALIFNILAARTQGVSAVVVYHSSPTLGFWNAPALVEHWLPAFRLADRLVVLARSFASYYRAFGIHSDYIPNPTFLDPAVTPTANLEGWQVIWVGRFSEEKQVMDALAIMDRVRKACPDAELVLVGKGETEAATEEVRAAVHRLGLDQHVRIAGFHADVSPFLLRASVYLHTSVAEGFCLALLESKVHGLPAVIYELPGIELARSGAGLVVVPQRDVEAAAGAIVKLLEDREYRQRMGAAARADIVQFIAASDVAGEWMKLFASLAKPGERPPADAESIEDYQAAIRSIVVHFNAGLKLGAPADRAFGVNRRLKSKPWWRFARAVQKAKGRLGRTPQPKLKAPVLPLESFRPVNAAMRNLYHAMIAAAAIAGVSVLALVSVLLMRA